MNEKDFWKSTPRKVGTLWKLHRKFNRWDVEEEKQEEKVCIDEIPFL